MPVCCSGSGANSPAPFLVAQGSTARASPATGPPRHGSEAAFHLGMTSVTPPVPRICWKRESPCARSVPNLGHETLDTTVIYTHLTNVSEARTQAALDKLYQALKTSETQETKMPVFSWSCDTCNQRGTGFKTRNAAQTAAADHNQRNRNHTAILFFGHLYAYNECYKPVDVLVEYIPSGRDVEETNKIEILPGHQTMLCVTEQASATISSVTQDDVLHWERVTLSLMSREQTHVLTCKCLPQDTNCLPPDPWPLPGSRQMPNEQK